MGKEDVKYYKLVFGALKASFCPKWNDATKFSYCFFILILIPVSNEIFLAKWENS